MSDTVDAHAGARTSVIIPARNAETTVAQTLDSLLAQSDHDWHAIIVDDGSTDRTLELCERYVWEDARFAVYRGPGAGASAARNTALSRARGRRILFLDSDDWIDASFLTRMNGAIDAVPGAVAAYCGYHRVMPDGSVTTSLGNPAVARAPFAAFARSCATAIHAVVISRDIVTRVGGFDPALRTCEDWDFWQRAARLGGRWVYVDEPLSYYRASAHSLTTNIEQMIGDARTVIGRGFEWEEHDAPAAPGFAGVPDAARHDAALAHAYFALWCAAMDCGRGGTGAAARPHLGALSPMPEEVQAIIDVLLNGVMVGLRAVPKQVAARWAEFGPAVSALVDSLGAMWSDPVAARRIQYRFERLVLDHDKLSSPRRLSRTLGLRVNLRDLATVTPPDGVDRLYVYLCDRDEILSVNQIGALGAITTLDWIELALARLPAGRVARCVGGTLAARLTPAGLASALRPALRAVRRAPWRANRRQAVRDVVSEALIGAARARQAADSHHARLDGILDEARALAGPAVPEPRPPVAPAPASAAVALHEDRRTFWDDFFKQSDPWHYGSPYEQEKYARQLDLLPAGGIDRALELACAEGLFTNELAARVTHLLCTDISLTALGRARERCRAHENIEFRQLDLVVDEMPRDLDLIVCSEVLYYLEDDTALAAVARRIAGAVRAGGHLLTAHAFVLQDDTSHTGFDWNQPFGAATIARTFAEVPGLALERSIQTELYRIDLFRRLAPDEQSVTPRVERATLSSELEVDVARHIVWGGATARRATLAKTETHERIPVLMYHSIAESGPESLARYRVTPDAFRSQLRWLRQSGYHSITSEELAWFLSNKHPFVGRPVVITFDDGFQNFADAAWPILRRADFGAEVFVVTDLVGQASTWERDPDDALPLLSASTIARLSSEGVSFGSHLATHRGADGLSTVELARELARSRAALERWIGHPTGSLAAPFGLTDERLQSLAAQSGYRVGYSTRDAAVELTDEPLDLPRIEVRGDWALDDFIARMESSR